MPDSYDPNELLGLNPGASAEDIRKAFRRKAKTVHPDVSDAPDAAQQFIRLQAAHDLLIQRLTVPTTPPPQSLYRESQPVSKEKQDEILKAHRRRRQAEQRRRGRRRSGKSRQTRQAEQRQQEFREEIERRRAQREAEERAERLRQERERERLNREKIEEQRRIRQEREERERKKEEERLAEERRERAERETAKLMNRYRIVSEPRTESTQEQSIPSCAWQECTETEHLSRPIDTVLGPRRFCGKHYRDYLRSGLDTKRRRARARQ